MSAQENIWAALFGAGVVPFRPTIDGAFIQQEGIREDGSLYRSDDWHLFGYEFIVRAAKDGGTFADSWAKIRTEVDKIRARDEAPSV